MIEEGEAVPVTLPIAVIGEADENIDSELAEAFSKLGKKSRICRKTGSVCDRSRYPINGCRDCGGRQRKRF